MGHRSDWHLSQDGFYGGGGDDYGGDGLRVGSPKYSTFGGEDGDVSKVGCASLLYFILHECVCVVLNSFRLWLLT